MDEKGQEELKERYLAAVDSFVDKVRVDPNVIAVIVGGSLAYDSIWEKSDIDTTVVIRDQQLKHYEYCIVEDGITLNVSLAQRSGFKRWMERNIGGSFGQSYLSKSKIVYCTDDSLRDYFEDMKVIGTDDAALSLVIMACELVGVRDKCEKWLRTRKDLLYSQYYLLRAAECIAHMEVCLNREPIGRDCIQKAMKLNPGVLKPLYTDAMTHHMSEEEIVKGIELIDAYLMERMDVYKKPVLEFLADQQIKTMTLIADHFRQEGHYMIEVFDYLAQKGIIEKVSQTIRITPKSKPAVEEIGYLYIP